jgi:sugar lactone lactonase YvrE
LVTPASIAIQPANDLLFVSDIAVPYAVRVFANVSTAGFNGNLPPIRTITSADIQSPIGINFGAGDTLYVANSVGIPRVSVFANASSANGPTAATRVITSTGAFTGLFDVFVDGSDRLFVVDSSDDQIHVFNNASTLNGNVSPSVTLTIPGAGTLSAIAVDAAGTGYVVDFALHAVYSYDNIATRNGTIPPDRTLQGANTQLLGPIRVFLLE